jgi:hypothetical protein
VRSRKGYFATKLQPATGPEALGSLLRDPLNSTAIGITTDTAADPANPGSYIVHAVVDLHDIHLEHQSDRWLGTFDVSLFVEGAKTSRTMTIKIDLAEAQLAGALEKGMEVGNTIRLDGPSGELRVVVQDRATGAAGSIRVALGKK